MSYQDFMNKIRYFDNRMAKWLMRHIYFTFFQMNTVEAFVQLVDFFIKRNEFLNDVIFLQRRQIFLGNKTNEMCQFSIPKIKLNRI